MDFLSHGNTLYHTMHILSHSLAPQMDSVHQSWSKHIKAVKKPYWRLSCNKPLGQMLITNQQIDKIAAACVDFEAHGMLDSPNMARNIASLLSLHDDTLESDVIRPQADERDEGRRSLDEQNWDDAGAMDKPESQAEVKLAQTSGESFLVLLPC